jgi:hypothetical protein
MVEVTRPLFVNEWIKLHWGITIPEFRILPDVANGMVDCFAHLIVALILSFIITWAIYKFYKRFYSDKKT